MKELYDIWFSKLDISNQTKLGLLENYSTKEIWELDFETLLENEVNEKEMTKIVKSKSLEEEKRNLEYMKNKNIQLISVKDEKYPHKLHLIDDKPAFLYIRGNEEILDEDNVRNGRLPNGESCRSDNC